ncbi:cupin domain-containing protein [Xylanibacillus composti]|uniref:Cupin n=1 Tax=Xylanibacillus composti TaxID=1572762 RepID=A0A8J4M3X7_9BACL|nr:cupin domain-containing protein [Xylanibacillus composti]MDT9726357.1 cupin domain-containing protein [Xylanibacillus composti]GIQ70535.1 cupin [Xylanibacillus composti]
MEPYGRWEQVEPGIKRKIHPPGERLMMMEVAFDTDAVGAEHSHPHEQYTYCVQGRLAFSIDGRTVYLSRGDSLHIPSGCRHGVRALEPSVLLDTFTPLREDLLKK